MRDHQHKPVRRQVRQLCRQQRQRHLAVDMPIEEGIQPVKGGEFTDIHFSSGVDTTTPAAAEDLVKTDALVAKIGTEPA